MKSASARVFMVVSASTRKCQKLHRSLVSAGSIAA
ncbi:hypothetical protein Y695_04692 [Hydrogenophaga sp. T4]|nr:hypothetical protein Y695_04692 [Hydrogenophaga sp. T4]